MRILVTIIALMLVAGCASAPKKSNNQDFTSVLKEVKKSFSVQDNQAKYCPVCGKHYSGHLEYCPDDKAKLLPVD